VLDDRLGIDPFVLVLMLVPGSQLLNPPDPTSSEMSAASGQAPIGWTRVAM
jgi:hypothetical protein